MLTKLRTPIFLLAALWGSAAHATWTQTSYSLVVKNFSLTPWTYSNNSGHDITVTNVDGSQTETSLVTGDARDYADGGPNWDSPWTALVSPYYVTQSWAYGSVTIPTYYTYQVQVSWQETVGDESWADSTQSPSTASRHADLFSPQGVHMAEIYNGNPGGGGG